MSQRHEPFVPNMHQPPDPERLRAVPPSTPACARVRGLLRDYADGDLSTAKVGLVDEHVLACRECAIELVRAEHEVLRLRRACAEIAAREPKLRPDFAARVVEQLVVAGIADEEPAPGGRPADGRPDGGRPDAGERDVAGLGPAGMLLAGLFVLLVLGASVRVFGPGESGPTSVARLVVLSADGTFGDASRRLVVGESLGDRESLWVRNGGNATIEWHDASERVQPAATIEVRGGELRLEDGSPMLVDGRVLIETNRAVGIPMADGSRIGLGIGSYVIAAQIPADMNVDEMFAPDGSALGSLGALEVEVEVLSGEPASVMRFGAPTAVVTAGNVGTYSGTGAIDVQPSEPVATVDGTDRLLPPPNPEAVLSGLVVDAGGLPSVGADVYLSYGTELGVKNAYGVSGANGGFAMPTPAVCESDFAIALAVPSEVRTDLGFAAPFAIPVVRQGGEAVLQDPVRFATSRALHGVVRDQLDQLRVGVHVLPCVVDELFGSVLMLTGHRTTTNFVGEFELKRLPAGLPHHQRLVLLLWHVGIEPTVVPVPERDSPVAPLSAVPFSVRQVRTVSMHGMPSNATLTVLEEVPGMPVGSTVVRRTVTTDAFGRAASVQVGRGRMWLRSGPVIAPRVQEMVLSQVAGLPRYRPSPEVLPMSTVIRPVQAVAETDLRMVYTYRYQQFEATKVENAVTGQALRVIDREGRSLERCEVFAVAQSMCREQPEPRFLGFTGATGVLSLGAVQEHEDVFVIGPDGSTGYVERPVGQGQTITVTTTSTGRVMLAPDLRPDPGDLQQIVAIELHRDSQEVLTGMQPVAVRFVGSATSWEAGDIPAGHYIAYVGGQAIPVVVPETGFVELTGN